MFRLHDTTRRRICIAAFFLLCVAPTAVVSAWSLWRKLPLRVDLEAQSLSRILRLDVSLDGLKNPRPGIVVYEGFGLADPETGQIVLRCPALRTAWKQTTDHRGQRKTSLLLAASRPQLQAATLDCLGRLLARTLQRQAGRPQCDVWLSVPQATLQTDENSQGLAKLQGSIESHPEGVRAQVVFRLVGVDTPEPIAIRVQRNRQTVPPATAFELSTGNGAVPCSLLAVGLDPLEALGPGAKFRGSIWARQTPDGWDGEVVGELLDVDLGSLVGGPFSHQLTGTAQVTIHSARFRGGRLQEASGSVVAGRGAVGRRLIDAAVQRLRLVPAARPAGQGELVPYEQLAFAFFIDSRGLQLQGLCPETAPGAIMVEGRNCLLAEPHSQPQPVIALLQALVPAARQPERLMRYLPVPQPATPEAGVQGLTGRKLLP